MFDANFILKSEKSSIPKPQLAFNQRMCFVHFAKGDYVPLGAMLYVDDPANKGCSLDLDIETYKGSSYCLNYVGKNTRNNPKVAKVIQTCINKAGGITVTVKVDTLFLIYILLL